MNRLSSLLISIAALVSFLAMSGLCSFSLGNMSIAFSLECAPTVKNVVMAVPPSGVLLFVLLLAFTVFFFGYKSGGETAASGVFLLLRPPPSHRISVLRFLQELFSRGILHPRLYSIA